MSLFSLSLILFLIMDPFGNISTFLQVLENIPKKRKRFVIFREMGIALFTMLIFYLIGDLIMEMLKVSNITVHLASGVILFLVAIKILFPGTHTLRSLLQNELGPKEEPFVVPLAIPLIAGPSLLATIILFVQLEPRTPVMLSAILIAWFVAMVVLFFGSTLKRVLTNNGLMACEKLMGMILVLLALQRFLEGIRLFVATCQVGC